MGLRHRTISSSRVSPQPISRSSGSQRKSLRVTSRRSLTALAEFDQLWEALAPREQSRVLELLVARVDYDGQRGKVSVTFQPTGIQSLTQELAHHQEHIA